MGLSSTNLGLSQVPRPSSPLFRCPDFLSEIHFVFLEHGETLADLSWGIAGLVPGRRSQAPTSEHTGHKGRVSPTFGKAGHPWHLQRPGGGAGCLHSSGEWNTDDVAVSGPWVHWGPPGSLATCPQPLRSQKVRSGPQPCRVLPL